MDLGRVLLPGQKKTVLATKPISIHINTVLSRDRAGAIERSKALLAFEAALDTVIENDRLWIERLKKLILQDLKMFAISYPGSFINDSIIAGNVSSKCRSEFSLDEFAAALDSLTFDKLIERDCHCQTRYRAKQ